MGDLITIYPSKKSSIVKGILRGDLSIEKAITGDSVSISLKDDIDISRGDVLCTGDDPSIEKKLDATICWLDNEPQRLGSKYILRQGTNESNSMITEIKGVLNVHTLDFKASKGPLTSNEIAQISLKSTKVIVYDSYSRNRITGSFILIDNVTGSTVAAGMISWKYWLMKKSMSFREKNEFTNILNENSNSRFLKLIESSTW